MIINNAAISYPDNYVDAVDLIKNCIDEKGKVSLKKYGSLYSSFADITHFTIDEVPDEEGYSNLDLSITYRQQFIHEGDQFSPVTVQRKLRVLCANGDNQWVYSMKEKVWDGDYPTTVAVDMKTGEVMFFSVKVGRLEFVEFGRFEPSEFNAFLEDLSMREPFSVEIEPQAMFDVISGLEGVSHLKRNVIIKFNSSIPIVVGHTSFAIV